MDKILYVSGRMPDLFSSTPLDYIYIILYNIVKDNAYNLRIDIERKLRKKTIAIFRHIRTDHEEDRGSFNIAKIRKGYFQSD